MKADWSGWVTALLALAALVVLVAIGARWWAGDRPHAAVGQAASPAVRLTVGPGDHEEARFHPCSARHHVDCVVDGDTIHYHGDKIRLTDINAPEISDPACDYELTLGERARDRLTELLNAGRFSLVPLPDRDTDVYHRKLRMITRGGRSLGEVLVAEGLAERWVGFRRDWCS